MPSCRNAVDITIEQTINRSAKTPGGLIGFSRNASVLHRWCVTRHKRATFAEATFERAFDMSSETSDIHKTTRKSEIQKSETNVLNVIAAFNQFVNPFQVDSSRKDSLFCISSGKPATDKIADHLLNYSDIGNKAAETFIKTRLVDKSVKFHDTLKKQNLQTFSSMAVKKTLTSSKKKSIQITAERNLLGRLLILSQQHDISLEKLFKYPLGPIPWALATADGGLVKTEKCKNCCTI